MGAALSAHKGHPYGKPHCEDNEGYMRLLKALIICAVAAALWLAPQSPPLRVLPRPLLGQIMNPLAEAPNLASLSVGLAAWWKLDEGTGSTATDSSGNGNTGTWNGTQSGTSGYYSLGKVGPWAGAFDGSTDFITASTVPGETTGSVTFWAKPTVATSGDSNSRYIWSSSNGCSGEYTASNTLYVYLGCGSQAAATLNWAAGTWHFVALVWRTAACYVYIDGGAARSLPFSTYASDANWYLGSNKSGASNFYGELDDIRLYSRALSASEIRHLYQSQH